VRRDGSARARLTFYSQAGEGLGGPYCSRSESESGTSLAPIWWGLFRDYDAFGSVRVEVADELVAAGGERSDAHQAFGLAGNDLLDLERRALEFLGGWAFPGLRTYRLSKK
jgi:hypothetical protein